MDNFIFLFDDYLMEFVNQWIFTKGASELRGAGDYRKKIEGVTMDFRKMNIACCNGN